MNLEADTAVHVVIISKVAHLHFHRRTIAIVLWRQDVLLSLDDVVVVLSSLRL
jgi:hypothetical protein